MLGRRPESEYLVSDEHRFIYCAIPKVAGSSLIEWFLALVGDDGCKTRNKRAYAVPRHGLGRKPPWQRKRCLRDYYKFAFVRDPWSRLVSAYLDKLVAGHNYLHRPALKVMRLVRGRRPAEGAGISFREFVSYLTTRRLNRENRHWRPVSWFLGETEFDFVGPMDNLAEGAARIGAALGLEIVIPERHAMRYLPEGDAPAADLRPGDLLAGEGYPSYRRFYDRTLWDTVGRLYRADIDSFGHLLPADSLVRGTDALTATAESESESGGQMP